MREQAEIYLPLAMCSGMKQRPGPQRTGPEQNSDGHVFCRLLDNKSPPPLHGVCARNTGWVFRRFNVRLRGMNARSEMFTGYISSTISAIRTGLMCFGVRGDK